MKRKAILLWFSFFVVQLVMGQHIDTAMNKSPQRLHDMYMQNRKTNAIIGWVMLGAGIGMTLGGIAKYYNTSESNNGKSIAYLGGALTFGSIPFFISAGNNKRKARLALKGESVIIGNEKHYKFNYTALALQIQLGGN